MATELGCGSDTLMAIINNKLSTQALSGDWLSPDDRSRSLDEDYEAGPIALNDVSSGLSYQPWHLTYDDGTGDFTVTPETTGSPVVVLNVLLVTQCSFAFDQNGHVNIAYISNGQAFLYWFDTDVANWVTTQLEFGVFSPTLCLDDKRTTQSNSSDILMFYTKEDLVIPETYNLYYRQQRDRFTIERELLAAAPKFIYKLGMHNALRVQLGLGATTI